MARLPRIPKQRAAGLVKLKKLDKESLRELTTALAETPPVLQPNDLINYLTSKISSIPKPELKQILELLVSLSVAQNQQNATVSELASDVCTVMEHSDDEELRLLGEECDPFKERLTELLNIESLIYPAKAHGIMVDHDKIFLRARVLTDIRPVFGPDIGALPKGAGILHMLRIAYHQSGEQNYFYIAMDSQDVQSLITTLQRALAKGDTLKTFLEKAGVACLYPE